MAGPGQDGNRRPSSNRVSPKPRRRFLGLRGCPVHGREPLPPGENKRLQKPLTVPEKFAEIRRFGFALHEPIVPSAGKNEKKTNDFRLQPGGNRNCIEDDLIGPRHHWLFTNQLFSSRNETASFKRGDIVCRRRHSRGSPVVRLGTMCGLFASHNACIPDKNLRRSMITPRG